MSEESNLPKGPASEPSVRRASFAKAKLDVDEPQALSKEEALALFADQRKDEPSHSPSANKPESSTSGLKKAESVGASASTSPVKPVALAHSSKPDASARKLSQPAASAKTSQTQQKADDGFSGAFQAPSKTRPAPTRRAPPAKTKSSQTRGTSGQSETPKDDAQPTRRSFLGFVLGLGGLAAGLGPIAYAAYKRPPQSMVEGASPWKMLLPSDSWKDILHDVGVPERLEVSSVEVEGWKTRERSHVVYALRTSDLLNEVKVFSAVCPHAGCLVEWANKEKHFECPCHRAQFTSDGTRTKEDSPAPRGLDQLEVRISLKGLEVKPQRFRLNVPLDARSAL